MTDATSSRLRRWALPCAIAALIGLATPDGARAADTSGLWIGSTYMHSTRSTKWVGFSDSSRGDFWFRVDGSGRIHGFAVVADEPSFDSERLNNLIGYIKGAVGAYVGLIPLPGLGAISSVALGDLIGVKVSFADPMPIRSGPITGTLHAGRLHLEWAGNQKSGLHFSAVMSYVDHEDPLHLRHDRRARAVARHRPDRQRGRRRAGDRHLPPHDDPEERPHRRHERLLDSPPGRRRRCYVTAATASHHGRHGSSSESRSSASRDASSAGTETCSRAPGCSPMKNVWVSHSTSPTAGCR